MRLSWLLKLTGPSNVSIGAFQTIGSLRIWPTLESGSKNKTTAKLLEMIMDLLYWTAS